jgi:hypothetical protein
MLSWLEHDILGNGAGLQALEAALTRSTRAFTELHGDARKVYGEMAAFLASVAAGPISRKGFKRLFFELGASGVDLV